MTSTARASTTAAGAAVTRPPLRFYGSGWQRAAWSVGYMPAHSVYCEPCFGSASTLLHKPAAKLEIANDLDGRVINFFQVLRARPGELVEAINLTPWHEGEYRAALAVADDPLEDARRFFLTCWASVRGGPAAGPGDFRWQKKLTRRSAAVRDVANLGHLLQAAARLKNVQFLQRDALDVIGRMAGTGALIYFDPPYLASTRVNRRGYRHEPAAAWHVEAADLLRAHGGPVIVAGYRSALYEGLYEAHGWQRVERRQGTNSGGSAVECLWLSPAAVAGVW